MPILGIIASSRLAAGAAGSYESIATVTVGSGGSATVSFTSIPATYTHLQIRAITRNSYSGSVTTGNGTVILNSDTGSNYALHQLRANGASVSAVATASAGSMYGFSDIGGTSVSNFFGAGIIDILDYTNTNKYKTIRVLTGSDGNTTNDDWLFFASGLWQNTDAVTTITLASDNPNYAEYSQFALYGIKS